jgi:hypothetical protein
MKMTRTRLKHALIAAVGSGLGLSLVFAQGASAAISGNRDPLTAGFRAGRT